MSAESTLEESLREEHRRRIAAELPSLGWVVTSSAILWFGLTGLVDDAPTRVPLPYRQVLAVFVFQSLVLVIASALARRDPTDRRVTAYAVGACTAVGLVWIWILTTTATVAAMLMFGTLMLFGAAPLVLAWRLGPQLTFQGTVTVAWIVALPSLARHVPRTELVAAIAFGNFLAVIATQWAVNAFHTEVFARLAALDFDRQMRASRDAYRALAENAVDFIWAIDLEGHWTYVNEALARRCGTSPAAMIGHPVTEILTAHPDNQDAIPLIARAAAGEPISARLWEMRTPEGSCWVEAVATQVIDARGVVVGIQGVSRDVTERRLAEEALRTSEERFRDVFHNAPIGIAVVSPSGEVLQSNRALAVMLGYSEAEAVGLRVWDVLHPEDVASVRRLVEATVAGERTGIAIECRHVHRDGHVVWTALHAILERAPDGTPRRFVSQLADITDRRAAESALRASERRFRTFAESMAGGVLIAEPDGIVYANDAISVITGYGRDELSRMQVWDLVHPDERASVHARVVARFEGVRTSPHAAYRIVTKAGDVRWVDLSIALIDLDGVPAILGTAFDVTERRRAQDALRASLDELRNSEDKLRSLAQRQVAVREEERKRLSFDLHDDVCQELVGVGILLESVEGRLGGRAPEVVSELRRAARYLSEVIEHLRVLARDLRPMSLQDLGLEASLRSLAGGLSSERTTVDAVFTTPVPRLGEAVEVTVYRIAQEALTNAIRHADARRVTLRLVVNGDRLFLDVSDDGCGFDHAERARHAFGLAIMEERAQALAGRLTVASRAGEGTRVSLDCPLAADPSASAAG